MTTNRDSFRARTIGAQKNFSKETLSLTLDDGQPLTVVVQQPTVADRALVLDAARKIVDDPEDPKKKTVVVDTARLQVEAVIATARTEDGEKAFDDADRDTLLAQPAGGWFDEMAAAAMRKLNVDLSDARKNSAPTPS
jgi:hypothetical protein